jgi:hypothetical protein
MGRRIQRRSFILVPILINLSHTIYLNPFKIFAIEGHEIYQNTKKGAFLEQVYQIMILGVVIIIAIIHTISNHRVTKNDLNLSKEVLSIQIFPQEDFMFLETLHQVRRNIP